MRKLLFSALLLFIVSTALAQEKTPTGSAERGYQAYMKYQCYTCHGTIGQGADRGAGPKLAPNPFPWVAFENQVRRPRQGHAALSQGFRHRPGARRHVRLSPVDQALAGREGYTATEFLTEY
jgi:mono/diheme cytochrome c family protein